jgi:rhodanese-related sulfurtransferase
MVSRYYGRLAAASPRCYEPRMNIPQTTPPEAFETLKEHPDAVYLDVRTEGEYEAGHPAGARNDPVLTLDPGTREPRPNPDFVAAVERELPRTTKLVVGCQAGGRSQHACELLAQAGWTDVTNVRGGFGGARDQTGRGVIPRWRDAGLPDETGAARPR